MASSGGPALAAPVRWALCLAAGVVAGLVVGFAVGLARPRPWPDQAPALQ